MRKILGVAAAGLLLTLGPAMTARADHAPGHEGPLPYVAVARGVQISADEVCVGAPVTITGGSFGSGATVTVAAGADTVASVTADARGDVSATVTLPEGTHAITVTGPGVGGVRTLPGTISVVACDTEVLGTKLEDTQGDDTEVVGAKAEGTAVLGTKSGDGVAANASALPRTGVSVSTPLLAGTGLVLLGALLLAVPALRRRRRA